MKPVTKARRRSDRTYAGTRTSGGNEVMRRRVAGASDASPNGRTMTTVGEGRWSPVLRCRPTPGVELEGDGEGDGPAAADAGPAKTKTRTRIRPGARPASRG